MCPVWGFGNLIALLDLLDYDSKTKFVILRPSHSVGDLHRLQRLYYSMLQQMEHIIPYTRGTKIYFFLPCAFKTN